jgi:hypothetical protein
MTSNAPIGDSDQQLTTDAAAHGPGFRATDATTQSLSEAEVQELLSRGARRDELPRAISHWRSEAEAAGSAASGPLRVVHRLLVLGALAALSYWLAVGLRFPWILAIAFSGGVWILGRAVNVVMTTIWRRRT